jgi:hypothetical protein
MKELLSLFTVNSLAVSAHYCMVKTFFYLMMVLLIELDQYMAMEPI